MKEEGKIRTSRNKTPHPGLFEICGIFKFAAVSSLWHCSDFNVVANGNTIHWVLISTAKFAEF